MGTGHETYGEDPYLTKELGVSFVKGLQGDGEVMKAAACAKHFAVHSGPEAIRHEFERNRNPKDMEETYLPAFEALTREADWKASWCLQSHQWRACCGKSLPFRKYFAATGLPGIFRFRLLGIKDFHEHHMVTSTPAESAALALNNGCDLNCGNTYLHILKAYEKGLISEDTITESAIRLFTTRYLLDYLKKRNTTEIPYSEVESPAHLALSQKAAEEASYF